MMMNFASYREEGTIEHPWGFKQLDQLSQNIVFVCLSNYYKKLIEFDEIQAELSDNIIYFMSCFSSIMYSE